MIITPSTGLPLTEYTWTGGDGIFNLDTHWQEGTAPTDPSYRAVFNDNNGGIVSFSDHTRSHSLRFGTNAHAYVLNLEQYDLTLEGNGLETGDLILNESNQIQTLKGNAHSSLYFYKGSIRNVNIGASTNEASEKIINQSVILYNSTITNSGDSSGNSGLLTVGGSLILRDGSSITNHANNPIAPGYSSFQENSTLSGGSITNTGGYTHILGDTIFTNVSLTNTADDNDVQGYLNIDPGKTLTLAEDSSISNISNDSHSAGYTSIRGTLNGGRLENTGAYTKVYQNGSTTPFFNKIKGTDVSGYTYFAVSNTTIPMSFDINPTTSGFAIVEEDASLAFPDNRISLYITGTANNFSNTIRTLVYGIGNATVTAPTTFLVKDGTGTPRNDLHVERVATETETTSSTAIGVGSIDDIPDHTPLHHLLRIRINQILEDTIDNPVPINASQKITDLSHHKQQALQRTTKIAMSVARNQVKNAFNFANSPSLKPSIPENNMVYKFGVSHPQESLLPITESMMNLALEQNARAMIPFRSDETGIWLQPFGQIVDQGTSASGLGHYSKTTGALVGLDHKIDQNLVVGGALGYTLTTTEARDSSKSMVKEKFLTLFSFYQHHNWIFEALVNLGQNHLKSGRFIDAHTKASNTHKGYQMAPSLGMSYIFQSTPDWNSNLYGNTTFIYSKENGYTETGAGAENHTLKSFHTSLMRTQIGTELNYHRSYEFLDAFYRAGISMIVEDPIKKGQINGTVGGNSFSAATRGSTTLRGGINLSASYALGHAWRFSANGAAEYGTHYHAHEVSLNVQKKLA